MRDSIRLATGAGFSIDDVNFCMRSESWTPPESSADFRLVFVRRGVYRLRVRDRETVADPATAYAVRAGDEQSIAHRVGARDASTTLTLSPALLAEFVPRQRSEPIGPLFTSGRVDLAHRVLYARASEGADSFELADRVLRLAAETLGDPAPDSVSPSVSRRRVVDAAREVLANDPVTLGLEGLADKVCVSPAYLSRIFRRETGHTLTRFRNRLRVRLVLDRLEQGETNLSRLATDLGFADHAHLTRTVREEIGCAPSAARRLVTLCRPSSLPHPR